MREARARFPGAHQECRSFRLAAARTVEPRQRRGPAVLRPVEPVLFLFTLHLLRTPEVEPGSQAWEACMVPLHYVRC